MVKTEKGSLGSPTWILLFSPIGDVSKENGPCLGFQIPFSTKTNEPGFLGEISDFGAEARKVQDEPGI